MWREEKKEHRFFFYSYGGNIYLLKAGPDLLSFCSSAMFAPLFSTRKEKVHVRGDIERRDEFQSRVCATNDARGGDRVEQACSTSLLSDSQRQEENKNLFVH